MIDVTEYILLPKEERQKHLQLNDPCIERGGVSTHHKGVLAQFLNTTIPSGRILLCHACGNGKCSNPAHLYWGTDRENIIEDGIKFGTWKSPWERQVEKLGYEEACRLNSRGDKSLGGKAGKGRAKTEDHKKKIADSVTRTYTNKVNASMVESAYTSDLKSDTARYEGSSPSTRTK